MAGNRARADWLSLIVAVATLLVAQGGLAPDMQNRTGNRLDRIEDKLSVELGDVRTELRKLGERVARLEGLAEIRPADAPTLPSD